jgi:hypothetical protein
MFCRLNSQLERDLHINMKTDDHNEMFFSELVKQKQRYISNL